MLTEAPIVVLAEVDVTLDAEYEVVVSFVVVCVPKMEESVVDVGWQAPLSPAVYPGKYLLTVVMSWNGHDVETSGWYLLQVAPCVELPLLLWCPVPGPTRGVL